MAMPVKFIDPFPFSLVSVVLFVCIVGQEEQNTQPQNNQQDNERRYECLCVWCECVWARPLFCVGAVIAGGPWCSFVCPSSPLPPQNKGIPTRANTAHTRIYVFSYLNDNNKNKNTLLLLFALRFCNYRRSSQTRERGYIVPTCDYGCVYV
jgi:hypothetical protein